MHKLFCAWKANRAKLHSLYVVQVTFELYKTLRKEKIHPQSGKNVQNPTANWENILWIAFQGVKRKTWLYYNIKNLICLFQKNHECIVRRERKFL